MARLINAWGIPIFDIGTVVAGAFAGYHKAKGIDAGNWEYVLTYAPTATALLLTPSFMLISRYKVNKLPSKLVCIGQDQLIREIPEVIALKEALSGRNIAKETVKTGAKTALETLIGYGAGYLAGSFF